MRTIVKYCTLAVSLLHASMMVPCDKQVTSKKNVSCSPEVAPEQQLRRSIGIRRKNCERGISAVSSMRLRCYNIIMLQNRMQELQKAFQDVIQQAIQHAIQEESKFPFPTERLQQLQWCRQGFLNNGIYLRRQDLQLHKEQAEVLLDLTQEQASLWARIQQLNKFQDQQLYGHTDATKPCDERKT